MKFPDNMLKECNLRLSNIEVSYFLKFISSTLSYEDLQLVKQRWIQGKRVKVNHLIEKFRVFQIVMPGMNIITDYSSISLDTLLWVDMKFGSLSNLQFIKRKLLDGKCKDKGMYWEIINFMDTNCLEFVPDEGISWLYKEQPRLVKCVIEVKPAYHKRLLEYASALGYKPSNISYGQSVSLTFDAVTEERAEWLKCKAKGLDVDTISPLIRELEYIMGGIR